MSSKKDSYEKGVLEGLVSNSKIILVSSLLASSLFIQGCTSSMCQKGYRFKHPRYERIKDPEEFYIKQDATLLGDMLISEKGPIGNLDLHSGENRDLPAYCLGFHVRNSNIPILGILLSAPYDGGERNTYELVGYKGGIELTWAYGWLVEIHLAKGWKGKTESFPEHYHGGNVENWIKIGSDFDEFINSYPEARKANEEDREVCHYYRRVLPKIPKSAWIVDGHRSYIDHSGKYRLAFTFDKENKVKEIICRRDW